MWSWIAGISSVIILILMGMKWEYSPVLGVFCQTFWFIYIIKDKQWGLTPCVVAYTVVHIINSFLWLK